MRNRAKLIANLILQRSRESTRMTNVRKLHLIDAEGHNYFIL